MKYIFSLDSLLAIACVALTSLLWHETLILSVALCLCAGALLYRSGHPHALLVFIVASIGGACAEMLPIAAGAWSYADPHFLGIPVWLPILWGNAALYILALARLERTR